MFLECPFSLEKRAQIIHIYITKVPCANKHDYIRIAKKRDSPSGSACNVYEDSDTCWKPTAMNFHWLQKQRRNYFRILRWSLLCLRILCFIVWGFSCLSVIKTWQINKLHVSFFWRKYLRPPREEIMHLAWHLFKALFTRREGYPSKHTFVLIFFVVFTRRPGLRG